MKLFTVILSLLLSLTARGQGGYAKSLELDCRVGAAVAWPVNLSSFALPPLGPPIWATAYPHPPTGHPGYWNPQVEYYLWDIVPPGYHIICNITIPSFSDDLALAREAADLVDYDYGTETDPVAISNGILGWVNQ